MAEAGFSDFFALCDTVLLSLTSGWTTTVKALGLTLAAAAAFSSALGRVPLAVAVLFVNTSTIGTAIRKAARRQLLAHVSAR